MIGVLHALQSVAKVSPMRWILSVGCWCLGLAGSALALPDAKSVVILYNRAVPESQQLAEMYRSARDIPAENLVGLDMPVEPEISREQYQQEIALPLRREFDQRGWWSRRRDGSGTLVPVDNSMRVLVTMRGVPLKIRRTAAVGPEQEQAKTPPQPFQGQDEAAVDSELAMVGVEDYPLAGSLRCAYFQAEIPVQKAAIPFMMLTARIDAPTLATCERMIRDAVDAERSGLWGMAYVDIANKIPAGDQWLETVVGQNLAAGIPTVIDRFNPTLPTNYPARDVAQYFGWYERNVSGPFVNPAFRFRKGAVAMHLHSFSAEQLRDPNRNWSAALLERGAAVTIGNVYEPYLHLTHDFGLLHQRLLAGFSWVEACWMAMPATSWQGVVLGDPLYRPFLHLDGTGEVLAGDREYRALRAAMVKWSADPAERRGQLKEAAVRMKSGVMFEALGLELLEADRRDRSGSLFVLAREFYQEPADRLRQYLHLAAIKRAAGLKKDAIADLRDAAASFAGIPEVKAAQGWLDILDPPPPPPAKPDAQPAVGKKPSPR